MNAADLSLRFVTGHPRAMALLDADGRVVVHSRGWIRQQGPIPDLVGTPLTRGDLLLTALARSSHPDAGEVDHLVREVLEGRAPTLQAEVRVRCGPDDDRSVLVVTALRLEGRRAVCLEFIPTTPPRITPEASSETPFREVVETLESVVFVTSPGMAGRPRVIHYVSPAYETVWGRSRSLLRDEPLSFLDSVHPDDREGVAANLWREARGNWDREFRIVRPEGSVRWIHSKAFPLRDSHGDVDRIVTLATDVTPRREVADALRRSRDELDQIFDRAPVALVLHQRGRVLKANRVAAAYLGEDHPASVTRLDLMERIHPDDRALADPLEGTGPRPLDRVVRIRGPQGDWVGYRAAAIRTTTGSGEPVSLLSLWGPYAPAVPITTDAGPAGREGVDDLFESAALGTAILDEHGRLLRANARLAGLLGWNERPVPTDPGWTLLPADQQRRAHAALRAVAKRGLGPISTDADVMHGTGHRVPLRLHLSALDPDHGAGRILVLAEDLTERRAVQDRQSQERRIESLGRLAGGIAHDFNNLMTVVTGHAELVLGELSADSPVADDVREIRSAGLRAASLTDQLLTFSRRQKGEPRSLDLGRLLLELDPDLRSAVGPAIDVVLDVPPGVRRIEADPAQMQRVVSNLVDNARDAMPRGGRIVISVRDRDVNAGDASGGPRPEPGPYVVLSVTDVGEGMDADVAAHIFEPFFTTRPPGHGTGLGLALVHGVVEEQHGHVEVRSAPGQGTTISLLLPARPPLGADPVEATPEPPQEALAPRPPDTGQGSAWERSDDGGATLLPADVLLVEDEEAVLRLGQRILESRGFRVRRATTGAEAVIRLSSGAALPDLVIADARLRDVDATTLVSAVRTVSSSLPILLLSAFDSRTEPVLDEPGVWVLPKPFTAGELTSAVRRALQSRNPRS